MIAKSLTEGGWSEAEYLELTHSINTQIELKGGRLDFLSWPTTGHQRILCFFFENIASFIKARKLGLALFGPLRVRTAPGEFREPDIVFKSTDNLRSAGNEFWESADLVVEVVSEAPACRRRDLIQKRANYATAGILEYWIVVPLEKRIIVLTLQGSAYVTLGEFMPGQQAKSRLLDGFTADVAETFKAAEG